jgi:very-short-patch-repair endonuclease
MRRVSRSRRIDLLVRWLADRQQGVVARWQLLERGVSSHAIDARVKRGLLRQAHRGVYVVGHVAPARFAKEMAAVLACGPSAVVSHRSAAAMMEILPYPARGDVWVTVPNRSIEGGPGIRIAHSSRLHPVDVGLLERVPITSPARTLVDLAAVVDTNQLERAVAQAYVGGWVTEAELRRQLERDRGRRGAGRLRALLDREAEPAHTKSEAERRLLRIVRAAGLPEPRANAMVGPYEVELLWADQRVVAEYDSFEFHMNRRAFRRDRERTNWLQLQGHVVLRLTWHDLTRGRHQLRRRLKAALGQGRRDRDSRSV